MENFEIIKSCPLFSDLTDAEINKFLKLNAAFHQSFAEEYLYLPGDSAKRFGLVIRGAVYIERTDYWGNRELLNKLCAGSIFGETFAVCQRPYHVGVKSEKGTEVLLISSEAVTEADSLNGSGLILKNLLTVMAEKNLQLNEKLQLVTRRTLRERVLHYLSLQAQKAGSSSFTIPFDRQQLADYLAADRSALSAVLGKLRAEGIIDFRKNWFCVITDGEKPPKWQ